MVGLCREKGAKFNNFGIFFDIIGLVFMDKRFPTLGCG